MFKGHFEVKYGQNRREDENDENDLQNLRVASMTSCQKLVKRWSIFTIKACHK